jgi:CRP/FNR family transcriptional regulator, cyclic AMP receptor protein
MVRLSTIERVLFLKSVGVFSAIPGEELAPLAAVARELVFSEGDTFIREGEFGDSLYIIVDGEVDVRVGGDHVATRGAGSVVGEMAVLSGHPRTATCTASTEVFALQLIRDDFMEMIAERPAVAIGVIGVLVERLDQATQQLADTHRLHLSDTHHDR